MRIRRGAHPERPACFSQIREGWNYVRTSAIRTILLLFSLISLMG